MHLDQLGELFLRLGGDLVHATRVGNGLLDGGLSQGGLQGDDFLQILGAEQGLGVVDAVFQHGTGGVQVQGGETLGAREGGVGQGEHGFDVGFVGASQLFRGSKHFSLLNKTTMKKQ